MRIRLLLLSAVVLLSACGGGGGSSSSGSSGDKENVIVVLGDSIGRGFGASINFPDLIAANTGIPVINASQNSISAEEGVAKAPGLIAQHNPAYIVSLLGTNNALGAAGKAAGAINAMQTLANICAANGIICIIGTPPPLTISSNQNADIKQMAAGYRAIAGVRIADNQAVMNGRHIGSDGIHPNDSGQSVIGQVFSAQLP